MGVSQVKELLHKNADALHKQGKMTLKEKPVKLSQMEKARTAAHPAAALIRRGASRPS